MSNVDRVESDGDAHRDGRWELWFAIASGVAYLAGLLAEFGLDIVVIIADDKGKIHQTTTVGALLPNSFSQANLDS